MLHTNSTDSELFEAIILNNEKAFNQLFERHWLRVYSIGYRYVKNEEDALEITHDIFLNIWNKRHQLQINSFKSYVVTAASYHGIRKRQTNATSALQYVEDYDVLENETLQHEQNRGECNVGEQEINVTVDTLLNKLPKRCQEIYLMSRQEQLSITEIAERLGISKRTVENQLTTALKHLRTGLKYYIILIMVADNF